MFKRTIEVYNWFIKQVYWMEGNLLCYIIIGKNFCYICYIRLCMSALVVEDVLSEVLHLLLQYLLVVKGRAHIQEEIRGFTLTVQSKVASLVTEPL